MRFLNILFAQTKLINSNYKNIRLCFTRSMSYKNNAKQVVNDVNIEETEKPVVYSQSRAATWKAKYSREGIVTDRLWYEPYVVLTSLAVFLIYFAILREESDIDAELNKSLYDRIPGLEEQQLILSLKYNQEHDLDTKAIETRLKEIYKENKK